MKNLILTLIITLPLTLWGQGWEQTYNNSIGTSVVECSDGNFLNYEKYTINLTNKYNFI